MQKQNEISPLDDEAFSKYTVDSATEIRAVLNFLRASNERVTVYLNHGEEFFLTSVVALSADGSELILDASSDEITNKRILRADKLICNSSQSKVKIHFIVHGVDPTKFEGRSAFLGNLPEALIRLQRREFLRLSPPVANPLKCSIPLQDADGATRFIEATVADLSEGGLALVLPPGEPALQTEMLLSDCRIDLPNIGKVTATMRVRSAYDVTLPNGKILKRSGCQFIKLPDAIASLIQRYIIQLERERRARGNREPA